MLRFWFLLPSPDLEGWERGSGVVWLSKPSTPVTRPVKYQFRVRFRGWILSVPRKGFLAFRLLLVFPLGKMMSWLSARLPVSNINVLYNALLKHGMGWLYMIFKDNTFTWLLWNTSPRNAFHLMRFVTFKYTIQPCHICCTHPHQKPKTFEFRCAGKKLAIEMSPMLQHYARLLHCLVFFIPFCKCLTLFLFCYCYISGVWLNRPTFGLTQRNRSESPFFSSRRCSIYNVYPAALAWMLNNQLEHTHTHTHTHTNTHTDRPIAVCGIHASLYMHV